MSEFFSKEIALPFSMVGKGFTLPLIEDLCKWLEAEKVVYCHWKSNAMIDRSARGDNDLDLLVDRRSVRSFLDILSRLGFKEARNFGKKMVPGISDYYGYDKSSHKLVHVHAHYQLIFGHDATKNYHLPIESPFLESAGQGELFKVPAVEFELILFVIRMVLKHSTWDVILARQGRLSDTEREELAYLQERADRTKVGCILEKHLPCIDAELFDTCLRAIQPECPWRIRVAAGWKLQDRLKAYARVSRVLDIFLKIWRRLLKAFQVRLFKYISRPHLGRAGAFVAIIGGDGAGKSTVIEGLHAWLSSHFSTIRIHMGKPAWSWTTILIRGVLKIGRTLGLFPFMRAPIEYSKDRNFAQFPGYPWCIREVLTARDRYLSYVKARCFADRGGLVICDRFPLPQVKFRDVDGPQLKWGTSNYPMNWFLKSLIRLEEKYYSSILFPELLILLRVNPETAVQRKVDEDSVAVRARSEEIWRFNWGNVPVHVIDASRPKAEVLSKVKDLVWSQL